jgi:modulator of FtsH protease HflK
MGWEDQKPPWGKKQGPSSPEELLAALLKKIKSGLDGSGPPSDQNGGAPQFMAGIGKIFLILLVIFCVYIIRSSVYTIEPGEQGVILRFGEYLKTTENGLHFAVPLIDSIEKIHTEKVRTVEFGFRTLSAGQKTIFDKKGYDAESLMLTGYKEIIKVEWIVQYNIINAENYLFNVRQVEQSVKDLSETALCRLIGNYGFDEILKERGRLERDSKLELQAVLDRYKSGVKIVTVKLQDVTPPDAVKSAFDEVNKAEQEMKQMFQDAEKAYKKQIPKAFGSAQKIEEEAHGYYTERLNKAKGETARFLSVLAEYKLAKKVTAKRMYLETMEKILPEIEEIYLIDNKQQSLLPFMDVGKKTKQSNAFRQ